MLWISGWLFSQQGLPDILKKSLPSAEKALSPFLSEEIRGGIKRDGFKVTTEKFKNMNVW